jgi:ABC-2 type transport system permease protein
VLGRLVPLVRKELQLAFRDPQSRRLLVLPVILQLALFPFAATLEVKNATLALLDEDSGGAARELAQRLAVTPAFPHVAQVHSQAELARAIDEQRALVALDIPPDFSRALAAGRGARVLGIVDGRRSNSGQIALAYAQSVIQGYGEERAAAAGQPAASRIVVRNWFNANLEYRWFMLPVLVAVITTLGSLIVTALSIAREREQGTFDQLLVSPLTPGLIMVGKTVPALIIAFGQATLIAAAAVLVYRVPFQGSWALLYLSMTFYALALAGFGLFISSLCATQQQAFLGVFTFMVPAIMLSGFIAPVENMPFFFRCLSEIDPLTHFIVIVKGLFLKGFDFGLIWPHLWPLWLISAATLTSAYLMFRRRIA